MRIYFVLSGQSGRHVAGIAYLIKQTAVRFELNEENRGTIVMVTEDGYRDDQYGRAMIVECASGWGEALTLLKFYMEHNISYTSATDKAKL